MRYSRLLPRLIILLGILLFAVPPQPVGAANDLCFAETDHCISGSFRAYWERNGGLAVFGFPITSARDELNRDTEKTHLSQWFERARFEQHAQNPQAPMILLGRLGAEQLSQSGSDSRRLPSDPISTCLWFAETRHNVCDQGAGLGFKSYWLGHGLKEPGLSRYAQSLALFGYPLTDTRTETNSSGDQVLSQWFERARFEWHPSKPDQYKVLLGRLGSDTLIGPINDLNKYRAQWRSKQVLSYDFVLEIGCFCPEDYRQPVLIEVRNGLRTSISPARGGAPLEGELLESFARFDTVEKLFGIIEDAARRKAQRSEITYDPAFGHPTRIWIDYEQLIVDEEILVTIQKLEMRN